MSLEGAVSIPIVPMDLIWLIVKSSFILLVGLYFIFSLIVVRQVNLMTETLITEVAPFLRAFAIIHAGVALGMIVLLIGFLFG